MQGLKGAGDGEDQLGRLGYRHAHARYAVLGRITKQAAHFALHPERVQIQHGVGEAILGRRFAVMHLARLNQNDLARHAVVALPPAMKALHALLGKADQIGVVPMRVVGVTLKMSANRLNAGIGILLEIDPVAGVHAHGFG